MLTIYGRNTSSNVQLVMWAVNELGLDHERLDYGGVHANTRTEEYLAKNPMGLVPVMEDGPVRMFESAAILRYLGARYGDGNFWPADPVMRGPMDTWAEWGKNTFSAAVLKVFLLSVRTARSKQDPAAIAEAGAAVAPLATMLNDRLSAMEWVGGDHFSFADIACGHILHRYHTMEFDRPDLPVLKDYFDRLQTRAAYRENAMVDYESLRAPD
ncbi:glutathione S-transferase family protein [Pseudooceanicola sp. C21-150M6]|uniref:glutathione S-transferase family protein n=1 Tax=Pseudooceanicola sp. C21-150M6 TaxID=3434355 RepID=UPI003D7FAC76